MSRIFLKLICKILITNPYCRKK